VDQKKKKKIAITKDFPYLLLVRPGQTVVSSGLNPAVFIQNFSSIFCLFVVDFEEIITKL